MLNDATTSLQASATAARSLACTPRDDERAIAVASFVHVAGNRAHGSSDARVPSQNR